MAKSNVEAVRLRPNTHEENLRILREVQVRKEVDSRKQDELNGLFARINAECASRSLRERRKTSTGDKEETINAFHYGPLPKFPSGKWWGIRMDCSRDCIHEPFNENVHDGPFGALSVCTSHVNNHSDIDLGDILTFTSHEYSATNQCKDSLILSFKNKVPVRLVRGYCLSNNYAPKTGYRYDGLYTVVENWVGISPDSTKHGKFVLVRVVDQEPPPWIEKSSKTSKILRLKKSSSPRLTRSLSNKNSQKRKKTKFVYSRVQKEPKENSISSIVSRQVFQKSVPGSRDSSPKSASSIDSTQSLCQNLCQAKLCNTNLSIRTNFYDSSHNLQDVKKSNMTFNRIFKPSPIVQKNLSDESVLVTPDISQGSSTGRHSEKKEKSVRWASDSGSSQKPSSQVENTTDCRESNSFDGFSSPLANGSTDEKCNTDSNRSTPITESKSPPSTACSTNKKSTLCKPNESSSEINSLAPDKLVSALMKEKYHPMAKLIIGNMIGLENQESSILTAYNALTSKIETDGSAPSKHPKVPSKFFLRSNPRKNGALKRQRQREIANLAINAKFDSTPAAGKSRNRRIRALKRRISKAEVAQRSRRMPARNLGAGNKEMCGLKGGVREQPKKPEKLQQQQQQQQPEKIETKPRMISKSIQCSLIRESRVHQTVQVGNSMVEDVDIKEELVEVDALKEEFYEAQDNFNGRMVPNGLHQPRISHFSGSAFAAVNGSDNSIRIARLRSIGFRPITASCSPVEENSSPCPDVDDEFNKYTSEDNDVVGYMNEQLHFEDIEDEEDSRELPPIEEKSVESLTDADFDKPWHGWKKICANGKIIWTGY